MTSFPLSFGIIAFGVGAVVGLVFVRLARGWAPRLGLLDAPDGRRKVQSRPIPVAGGPAVFLASLVALAVVAFTVPAVAEALAADIQRSISLLIGCAMIVALGVADDRYNLRPHYKLAGQLIAILTLVVLGGFLIDRVEIFRYELGLDALAGPLTVFCLLFCVNALNLIDGMDGLLGTVGLIALLSLGVLAAVNGQLFAASVAFAVAGALVGFLWFNLPPASVYIGDAGSMLVGLVVGAVAIPAALKGPATVAILTPIALLILPMTDTAAAVIRRKLTGRGIASADRGHLHHVLQRRGLTVRGALTLVAALAGCAAAGAFTSTLLRNDLYALVAMSGVVVTLLASRLFGDAEFRLVVEHARSIARRQWNRGATREVAVRLQGTADWARVWRELVAYAREHRLRALCLDVNAPRLAEDYHAKWEDGAGGPAGDLWRFDLPLVGRGHAVGRLIVTGWRDEESIVEKLLALARIVERTEARVDEVIGLPAPAQRPVPKPIVAEPLVLVGADKAD